MRCEKNKEHNRSLECHLSALQSLACQSGRSSDHCCSSALAAAYSSRTAF